MSLYDVLTQSSGSEDASRVTGVAIALVTNNQDPDGLGRVKVKFPWLADNEESWWARVSSIMAGKGRGAWFLPEVDDEVLVAFEHGDIRNPIVLGAMWNGVDEPPTNNNSGTNDLRMIRSRSGHEIRLNDENGAETVEIIDGSGNNKIRIATADNSIEITCTGPLKIRAREIELQADMNISVKAGANLELNASAQVNASGAIINLN